MKCLVENIEQCNFLPVHSKTILRSYLNYTSLYGKSNSKNKFCDLIGEISLDNIEAYAYWLLDYGRYDKLIELVTSLPSWLDTLVEDLINKLIKRHLLDYALKMSYAHSDIKKLLIKIPELMFIRTNYDIPLTSLLLKEIKSTDNLIVYFFKRSIELCFKSIPTDNTHITKLLMLTLSPEHEEILETICLELESQKANLFPIFYHLINGRHYSVLKYAEKLGRLSHSDKNTPDQIIFNDSAALHDLNNCYQVLTSFKCPESVSASQIANNNSFVQKGLIDEIALIVNRAIFKWQSLSEYDHPRESSQHTEDVNYYYDVSSSDDVSQPGTVEDVSMLIDEVFTNTPINQFKPNPKLSSMPIEWIAKG